MYCWKMLRIGESSHAGPALGTDIDYNDEVAVWEGGWVCSLLV